ncbi:malto-oligosyltrehalose synthase [Elioraea sp.]|uniref:malto-oligosyltrehalose synthase n=1 Tax=Elioraea sp. TaxID=2185103 RepID=UPI003F721050
MAERDPPRATYRLQFGPDCDFARAAELAPYLARLGVSHLYASPYLKARPGSMHGYDIVDHRALNPELGDEASFRALARALHAHGLGQILDFVPNHMGVGGADNPAWLDVLEWGEDSPCAGWFDIDWDPDRRYLTGKVLVPFLGDQYGVVLEAGELVLRFDAEAGTFAVWAYGAHRLPVCPLHYGGILGDAHPVLEQLGDAFAGLASWRALAHRRAGELKAELARQADASTEVRSAIEAAVARLNGSAGEPDTWRALHALIQDQHWRVAHFRVAADDINYRRFFNINELAGLRMELPELFDHAHALVLALIADGTLDGLRIDHVDGLLDPKAYLERLRARAARPIYLVIEKILAHHEALREDWPVEGTTGYEFANLVLGLLVDPAGEAALTRCYAEFTGMTQPFPEIVRDCKLRIMEHEMASELTVLARDAGRIARQNPRTADFTRNVFQRALKATIACFPVYRTYVDGSPPAEADRRDIDWAIAQARRLDPDLDASVFDMLHRMLTTDLVAEPRNGFSRNAVVRFAMRVQQLSGPVMAKGLEDTAFYRYNRFVALNEVGGHPEEFGVAPHGFHRATLQRARRWPQSMLATSTHDTKRGEDTRARLAVLSELPDEWARQVQAWSRILRARRGDVEGTDPPDRNDEYLFYQLLVGTWPPELAGEGLPKAAALADYAARIEGAMLKSLREAKLRTTWAAPDAAYEDAVLGFVRQALDPERSATFLGAFLPFQDRIARLGVRNSLVQTALKLTAPGVPDLYQGAELWDFSLVDPDNRRPVDFARRERLLDEVTDALAGDREAALHTMLDQWPDGRIKLALVATALRFRAEHPALFAEGSYEPLGVEGEDAECVCGYLRRNGSAALLVAVQRFPARCEARAVGAALSAGPSGSALPDTWRDLLSGRRVTAGDGAIPAAALFATVPVALLVPAEMPLRSA